MKCPSDAMTLHYWTHARSAYLRTHSFDLSLRCMHSLNVDTLLVYKPLDERRTLFSAVNTAVLSLSSARLGGYLARLTRGRFA